MRLQDEFYLKLTDMVVEYTDKGMCDSDVVWAFELMKHTLIKINYETSDNNIGGFDPRNN